MPPMHGKPGKSGEMGQRPPMPDMSEMPKRDKDAPAKWTDVHGAGSQRSDPKVGNAEDYADGHGPQGDAIRINNYVRLVRDVKK